MYFNEVMNGIITISGPGGSGKSTIARAIKEKLNAERIYVGGIRREFAKKIGMTLNELNAYAIEHPESDVEVDKEASEKARSLAKENLVIVEGRTQFHFLPESFKVYIKCDLDTSVKRIWSNLQESANRNEGNFNSEEELRQGIIEREKSDLARYKKYYNLNHKDESQYDYILDTTNLTQEEAIGILLKIIKEKFIE